MKLRLVVDNKISIHAGNRSETIMVSYPGYSSRNLIAEHGFSLLIENGKDLYLFDAGSDTDVNGTSVLRHNLKILGINTDRISRIILSHRHSDHVGGLPSILENRNSPVDLLLHQNAFRPYFSVLRKDIFNPDFLCEEDLPSLIEKKIISKVKKLSDSLTCNARPQRTDKTIRIAKNLILLTSIDRTEQSEHAEGNFYSLVNGSIIEDDCTDDSSLIVETDRGYFIVSGCCHSGLINTINKATERMGVKDLIGIIGGFHLYGFKNRSMIIRARKTIGLLKEIKPEFVVPCHCTEEDFSCMLRKSGITVLPAAVGMEIE